MSVHRQIVDVKGVAAFPAANAPSVVFPFEPKRITFIALGDTAGDEADLSFDGGAVHGTVAVGGSGLTLAQRAARVWLKEGDTSAGAAIRLQVIAES